MKYYGSGLLVAAYLSADKFEWFGGSDDYIDKFTGTGRAVSDEHFRVDFRRVPLGASYGVVVRGVGIIFSMSTRRVCPMSCVLSSSDISSCSP